jgi:hypothetical protein
MKKKKLEVKFYFYEDDKSFLPLAVTFGRWKLSKDEQTIITIMKAKNKNVKKVNADLLF